MGPSAWDLSPARVFWLSALRDADEDRARRARILDTAIAVSRAAGLALGGKEALGDWRAWVAEMSRED